MGPHADRKEPSSENDGRSRRRRARPTSRRRRALPVRDIGRKVVIVAAANTFVSLLLPWIGTDAGGISAFGLSGALLDGIGAGWIAPAIWTTLAAAVACVVLAAIDRIRSLGASLAALAIAVGAGQIAFASYAFATVLVLRQVGALACALGGLVYLGGGALVLRGRWTASPQRALSFLARPAALPWITIGVLGVNLLAFLALAFRQDYDDRVLRAWGLIAGAPTWYTFLTCHFLHANWFHLLTNMAVLAAVGAVAEPRAGRAAFGGAYLAGGLAGAVLTWLVDPHTHVPMIGSSGAVAGVVGLCLGVAPRAKVRLWVHAVVVAGRIELQAAWLFSAWIALQAIGSFYLAIGEADGVAYWGHLGGVAIGLSAGLLLRRLRPRQTADEPGSATARGSASQRARRYARGPFELLPHALTAIALLVSIVSVALTFSSGSLPRALSSFAEAWNTGELERIVPHFAPDARDVRSGDLARLVARLDPDAPEGRTTFRIALRRAAERELECRATYLVTRGAVDPYRARRGGELYLILRRETGTWWVRGFGLSGPDASEFDAMHVRRTAGAIETVGWPYLPSRPERERTREAVVVMVTNPVDVLAYFALKHSGMPPARVIGSGTVLDSARFRYALSRHHRVDPRNVHAYVVGEHGDSEVFLWSQAHIGGIQLETYCETCTDHVTSLDRAAVMREVRESAYHVIEAKGATYYAVSLALERIVAAILRDERSVLTVSRLVEGEYGIRDVCLSLPCVVDSSGASHILHARASEEELEGLRNSARVLREAIEQVEASG